MVSFMSLGCRGYSVNGCSVCSDCCAFCLKCDACSYRCYLIGSMLVSSCKCCVLASLVHPESMPSTVFCIIFSFFAFVSDVM